MKRRLRIAALIGTALVAAVAATGSALYHVYPVQTTGFVAMTRNTLRSWFAPPGTITTELNPAYRGPETLAPTLASATLSNEAGDWPSYNKTVTSERFSDLKAINANNVGRLNVLCTYDTKEYTNFESGLIMVNGANRHD